MVNASSKGFPFGQRKFYNHLIIMLVSNLKTRVACIVIVILDYINKSTGLNTTFVLIIGY